MSLINGREICFYIRWAMARKIPNYRRRRRIRKILKHRNHIPVGYVACALCGKPIRWDELTVDHILPKSLGGSDKIENLQFAHRECNNSKGNKYIVISERV